MKVVILAGGKGTRIREESQTRPKPMVTIGGMPILWHIMKIYSRYGFRDFIICCGYKGEQIKKFFINYDLQHTDMVCDLSRVGTSGKTDVQTLSPREDWEIILANTGLHTLTAGRILKIKEYIGGDEEFMLTYGDGVADIDISRLLRFHRESGRVATISVTKPEGRFGAVKLSEGGLVESFREKARRNQSYVNIGFMVVKRQIFDYLGDGSDMLEHTPFERLVREQELAAYRHEGFWSPMDNINDRAYLEKLWKNNQAKWKIW